MSENQKLSLAIVYLNAELEKQRDRADRAEARLARVVHGDDCEIDWAGEGQCHFPNAGTCTCGALA